MEVFKLLPTSPKVIMEPKSLLEKWKCFSIDVAEPIIDASAAPCRTFCRQNTIRNVYGLANLVRVSRIRRTYIVDEMKYTIDRHYRNTKQLATLKEKVCYRQMLKRLE